MALCTHACPICHQTFDCITRCARRPPGIRVAIFRQLESSEWNSNRAEGARQRIRDIWYGWPGEGGEKKTAARGRRRWRVKTNDIGSLETRWRRGQPRPGATSCIGTRTRNESSRQSRRFLVGLAKTCLERQLTGSAMPSGPAPPRYDALCFHRVPLLHSLLPRLSSSA